MDQTLFTRALIIAALSNTNIMQAIHTHTHTHTYKIQNFLVDTFLKNKHLKLNLIIYLTSISKISSQHVINNFYTKFSKSIVYFIS